MARTAMKFCALTSCLLLLLSVQPSLQQNTGCLCTPCGSSLEGISIDEGASSEGHILFNTSTPAELRMRDNAGGYLAVNTTQSGNITTYTLYVAKPLDYEKVAPSTVLTGRIECRTDSSGSWPTYTVRLIVGDVNEFPPTFDNASYFANVPENAPTDYSVFSFFNKATDSDKTPNQEITYAIVTNSIPFTIRHSRDGDVRVNGQLDFEQGPRQYILNVSAAEMAGSPLKTTYTTLTINITDVDDLGPEFGNNGTYKLVVDEGTYNGQLYNTIPPLSAVDGDTLNTPINFTADPTSVVLLGNKFSVLNNGSIAVTGSLDPGTLTLNVRAYQVDRPTDRFSIASVVVTVRDVNNNPPVMSRDSYSGAVLEESQAGTVVMTVYATDRDQGANGQFEFHLNGGTEFSITTDGNVGIITVTGRLDRETKDSYTLQVYAQENSTQEHHNSNVSRVTITILDVNDNSPVFHNLPYNFTVNQTATAGQRIGQVSATDADSGDYGRVSYSITNTGGVASACAIASSSGVITINRNLARSDVGVVSFLVQAEDNAAQQVAQRRSSVVQVTVNVLSVNQHPPVFTPSTYNFSVSETAHVGFTVGSVMATDQDQDSLTYTLSGNTGPFELVGTSLLVKGSLDLDVVSPTTQYTLSVQATDGPQTATTSVTVHVQYENEFSPVVQPSYQYSVYENATSGTEIVRVNATDRDKGSDGTITYSIMQNTDGAPVTIDSSTGIIKLTCSNSTCLDYNIQQRYLVVVEAKDGGNPAEKAETSVFISVVDVNNKAPYFTSNHFFGTVPENTAAGYTVLQLQARDDDTNPQLRFTVVSGDAVRQLKTQGAYIVTATDLDAEAIRFITGIVQVSDGLHTTTATINVTVLDVNDNYPQVDLPQNPVSLPENTPIFTHVLQARATDRDVTSSGFTFWLEQAAGKFSINRTSGDITVVGPFDRRVQRHYSVDVWVSDNSSPPKFNSSTLQVNITDSNNAPIFVDSNNSSTSSYTFNVSENQTVGSVVGRLYAFDPDSGSSGELRYSLTNSADGGTFSLNPTSGELTLNRELDFESTKYYSLTVAVTDSSFDPKSASATVTVNVLNVVEAPHWPSPMPVVTLTSNDQCGDVQSSNRPRDVGTYTAISRAVEATSYMLLNLTNIFTMNNSTGLIRTLTGNITAGTYQLPLRACTGNTGVCSDTTATINVTSDDAITFCPSFLTVQVNESAETGHVIADLNTTKGDNNVIYSFAGSTQQIFSINSKTGVVTLNGALDRETIPQWNLLITALYQPTSRTATAPVTVIVLDAPDWKPQFGLDNYEGEISEAAHPGSYVTSVGGSQRLRLIAEDRDLDPVLSFSILSSEDGSRGAFAINSTTGEITLIKSIDLEAMAADLNDRYTFRALVSDGYFTATTTVVVRVLNDNDNDPQFQPDSLSFTLSESHAVPSVIARLNATDGDVVDRNRLNFSILSDDGRLPFSVGGLNGQLKLDRQLDRETTEFYTFRVIATDPGGRSGTAQINITVTDSNDMPPVFEKAVYNFSVTEGPAGVGSGISVTAHDNDIGKNAVLTFTISGGNDNGAFNVTDLQNSTAVVRLVKALDREDRPIVSLVVKATDGGQPTQTGTCTVEVHVLDVNDNPPEFEQGRYTGRVSEGATNDTQVLLSPSVIVTDRDEGVFGPAGVVFSLYDRNSSSLPFRVDSKSGDIYVFFANGTVRLDRETTPSYTLTLVATDQNGNGISSTTTVLVILSDVNDHPPEFTKQHYEWMVSENVTFGYRIDNVTAIDVDIRDGDVNPLRYSSTGGEGKFYLDRMSGELFVAGPLDRESRDHYQLVLNVTDGLYYDIATANVIVEDVNDNCPDFHQPTLPPLVLSVVENQTTVLVHKFNVTDKDLGENGRVELFLHDTGVDEYLSLSPDGKLETKGPLDRENENERSMTFTVWAHDGGQPPCVTSLRVQLDVRGVNEYTPQICQITQLLQTVCAENLTVTAFNGSVAGTFLAVLRGSDQDEGQDGRVTMALTSNRANLLSINTNTGILSLAKTIIIEDLINQGLLGDDDTYLAEVTATDGGNPTRSITANLTVKVQRRTPNTPVFSSHVYNFTALENKKDLFVGSVVANLPGNEDRIVYRLESTQPFSIDNQGKITTTQGLDRETKDHYAYLVLAWDAVEHSDTSSAVVLVTITDENDNRPVFSSPVYGATVLENTDNTNLTTLVATDRDLGENGRVTYTLLNTSLGNVFTLNDVSGVIWLNQKLDRENVSSYTLLVQATDAGSPPQTSTAVVLVTVGDENDNAPVFQTVNIVIALDENKPPATSVVTVPAEDRDEGKAGQVMYRLQNDSSFFYINEFTGTIFTSLSLDFENQEQIYTLHVIARDLDPVSPLSSTATVTVYVNNLPDVVPILTLDPPHVALVLGTPPDTTLPLNVSASGASGNFIFTITDGNSRGLFAIDERNGRIRVTSELTTTAEYTLTIRVARADAQQYYATGQLVVTVTAVTLGQESYAAVWTENDNSSLPALILDINSKAEGVGASVMYRLLLSDPKDPFYIVPQTGEIFCNAILDREVKPQYTMQVSVQLADSVQTRRTTREVSSTATVTVFVGDVNDNPPYFDLMTHIFGIPDTAPAYTVVTKLKAVDPDEGVSGQVVYRATSGDTDVMSVTQEGEVRSLQAMSDARKKTFDLTVVASDTGERSLSSTPLAIKIVVVPASDRFGLVAGITVDTFTASQSFYVRNLSAIMNMTLHLYKTEPHQGETVDTSKSDIYFYAFDKDGNPIPFATTKQRVTENADAINRLLGLQGVEVIPVTEPPERVRVVVEYKMGAAEIAVLVVACLILAGSLVAICIVYRQWKKQKAFQKREEDAARARQRLEQETRELADKMQESTFIADPEEPLELSRTKKKVAEEEQELVMYLDSENKGIDTIALRRAVQQKEAAKEAAMLETLLEEQEPSAADSGLDLRTGSDANSGSGSSDEHRVVNSDDGSPGPRASRASPTPEASEEKSSDTVESSSPAASSTPQSTSVTSGEQAAAAASSDTSSPKSKSDPSRLSHSSASDRASGSAGKISTTITASGAPAGKTSSRSADTSIKKPEDAASPEDPTPDYPGLKKVSFAGIPDEKVKKEVKDTKSESDMVDGALNRWSEDYNSNNLPTHDMTTAL